MCDQLALRILRLVSVCAAVCLSICQLVRLSGYLFYSFNSLSFSQFRSKHRPRRGKNLQVSQLQNLHIAHLFGAKVFPNCNSFSVFLFFCLGVVFVFILALQKFKFDVLNFDKPPFVLPSNQRSFLCFLPRFAVIRVFNQIN